MDTGGDGNVEHQVNKSHRVKKKGAKLQKKKKKHSGEQQNAKAFSVQSSVRLAKEVRRRADIKTKKHHIPVVDRTVTEPPPVIVAIVGPPRVGKTTLIRCIIKHYTKQKLSNISGHVTVVTGKNRRLTLLECNNDINSMIDISKVADLVLLLVDASFGFEMETFEFLNIAQVHGFPRMMGVLTHLDVFKNNKTLNKTKKRFKQRFWTEVYQGAKLFYLSGIIHGEYQKTEIHNLCRFISVMKFRPMVWRTTHPHVLVDRMEDVTDPELCRVNPKSDRTVCLYGYVRGAHFRQHSLVHIAGMGDFSVTDVSILSDPCPLPGSNGNSAKKRSLNDKERNVYAPLSGVGGIVYDRDAVYIDLGGSHSHDLDPDPDPDLSSVPNQLITGLTDTQHTLDSKVAQSKLKIFKHTNPLMSTDCEASIDDTSSDEDISEGQTRSHSEVTADTGAHLRRKVTFENDSESETDSECSEVEDSLQWKEDLSRRAKDNYYRRQHANKSNLKTTIYGEDTTVGCVEDEEVDVAGDVAGLFTMKSKTQEIQEIETTKFDISQIQDWISDQVRCSIRDCFVTGRWNESEDAATILQRHDEEEMFGDFEDLESGEVHTGTVIGSTDRGTEHSDTPEQRFNKKISLKAQFDTAYDNKGDSTAVGDETYFNELKEQMTEQALLNRTEFEGMDSVSRVDYEGFRPGLYVRMELSHIPCEFVVYFNPTYPVIVGALLSGESNIGYIQARLKKHRWYERVLKARDPVIVSMGWRRFQSVPIYSIEDHNERQRFLKYTPEHMHCHATLWGPITPQGTGLLVVQSVADRTANFRIAATGVVLDLDKSLNITKKLKLIGHPFKIFKNTAFIKGMFTSKLEVVKFEGATLRSVSGLRGQIKKAIQAPDGAFRATFEDKLLMSDIVFLKCWFPVDLPKYYNPITSLLLPTDVKDSWSGMKTVGRLRFERGLRVPKHKDSLYQPIERQPRRFHTLVIPGGLQKSLPFKNKPKVIRSATQGKGLEKAGVVIREPGERKVSQLMDTLRSLRRNRELKLKEDMRHRVNNHKQQQIREGVKIDKRQREARKKIFRALGQLEKKKKSR